jgi:hypothetical protein
MTMSEKHQRDRDMSEAGINRRMRKLSELYQLWRSVNASCRERPRQVFREPKQSYRTRNG